MVLGLGVAIKIHIFLGAQARRRFSFDAGSAVGSEFHRSNNKKKNNKPDATTTKSGNPKLETRASLLTAERDFM